jgi:nitrite reductase/ring-hydroxylating ferredoxin subunit
VLGPAADVPVGGGVIYAAQQVVVTQPTEGTFRAFSAVCTHARCLCSKVSDGTIYCPCHGSTFAITDGAVVQGPASRSLTARRVTVEGGTVRLA